MKYHNVIIHSPFQHFLGACHFLLILGASGRKLQKQSLCKAWNGPNSCNFQCETVMHITTLHIYVYYLHDIKYILSSYLTYHSKAFSWFLHLFASVGQIGVAVQDSPCADTCMELHMYVCYIHHKNHRTITIYHSPLQNLWQHTSLTVSKFPWLKQ